VAYEKYRALTEVDIKTLTISGKWLSYLSVAVENELNRVSQSLAGRIHILANRYTTPLPQLTCEAESFAARVSQHLKKMGATWR
jgi:type I restriction enzyme M protein